MDNVVAATTNTLRAIATRWLAPDEEIRSHDHLLATLTGSIVPRLIDTFEIAADMTAEPVIVLRGQHRTRSLRNRVRSRGTNPIPASSGKTTRHQLNRGGHRQTNAALYRTVIVRTH